MSARLISVLTLLLLAPLAHAAVDCANASDQATMNQCAGQDFTAADKELNTLYQQIIGRLKDSPDSKKLLVSAQRAWVTFRDAECKFSASGVEGGSVYPLVNRTCLTGATKARVEGLKSYLKCEEGDMSCPVPRS